MSKVSKEMVLCSTVVDFEENLGDGLVVIYLSTHSVCCFISPVFIKLIKSIP